MLKKCKPYTAILHLTWCDANKTRLITFYGVTKITKTVLQMFQLTEKRPIYHFTLKHWLGLTAVCSSDSTIWLFWQRQDTRMYQQTPAPNKSQTIHFNTPSKQQRTGDTHTHQQEQAWPRCSAANMKFRYVKVSQHICMRRGEGASSGRPGSAHNTRESRGNCKKNSQPSLKHGCRDFSTNTDIYIYIYIKSHIRGMSCDQ